MKRFFIIVAFLCILFSCEKNTQEAEIPVSSVSLSQPTAEMIIGETVQLVATVLPSNAAQKTITWASSKASVATVEAGRVTAITEGTATITASAGGKSATCVVIVSKGAIAVTSVELNKTTLELVEGDAETLIATVKPDDATDKTVMWSTPDASIATVENGKVTAMKEGEATITATAGGQIAACIVIVEHNKSKDAIVFADTNVKAKLVAAFDSNNDGEISYEEAATVTSINDVFGTSINYTSFDEFQYFTSVTSITKAQFQDWQIKSIVLPNSIQRIEENAFCSCFNLESICIPESVKTLNRNTFWYCVSLSSIQLPSSLETIMDSVFRGCESLSSITIPESVSSIGACAFEGCVKLSEIAIPVAVSKIDYSTFKDCTSLASVTLPETIKAIMNKAFQGCTSLSKISIPESITRIEDSTFSGCNSLKEINLPITLEYIGFQAFLNCGFTELVIPKTVILMRAQAFGGCEALTQITVLPETPPSDTVGDATMKGGWFVSTNNCPIYVPAASVDEYKTAEGWTVYSDRIYAIP